MPDSKTHILFEMHFHLDTDANIRRQGSVIKHFYGINICTVFSTMLDESINFSADHMNKNKIKSVINNNDYLLLYIKDLCRKYVQVVSPINVSSINSYNYEIC